MAISKSSLAKLRRDLARSKAAPTADLGWGQPLDLRHLTDQEISDRMEELESSIAVDMAPYADMGFDDLLREYVSLLN
jgi:hypothetical protein